MKWKKWLCIGSGISASGLAALAAYGGGAICYGAAEGTSLDYIKTTLAALGSLGSMIVSAIMAFKSGSGVSPTRAAEIAALSTLAATCMTHGDAEGVRLIGQLADYLKGRADNKPTITTDAALTPGGLLKLLEDKIREQIAGTVHNLTSLVEIPK